MAYFDRFGGYDGYAWRPYVSKVERRQQARAKLRQLRKDGHLASPVEIDGRKITTTFWGQAWCENLERYSDYANRLPRGRTYVRNGSVIDLQIAPGVVTALVSGSEIYEVTIKIASVPPARWRGICGACAGGIDSLVELLQGRFSDAVMTHLCQQGRGLFPTPKEIEVACSCPDWASMCKHVAAVLYGIGARFDREPELLFRLRRVDEHDLVARAGAGLSRSTKTRKPAAAKVLAGDDLSQVFGVDVVATTGEPPAAPPGRNANRPAGPPKTVNKAGRAADERGDPVKPRRARTPAVAPTTRAKANPTGSPVAGHARMTAAQRKAVVERMRRYWQERRTKARKK